MKKSIFFFAVIVASLFITSCVTTGGGSSSAIRVGNIPNEIPNEMLSKVVFSKSVVVLSIDGVENEAESLSKILGKSNTEFLDSSIEKFSSTRTVYMMPGSHRVVVRYNNGRSYTSIGSGVDLRLEAGKSYTIKPRIESNKVSFEVVDTVTGKSISNPNNNNLRQKAILAYVSNVVDPAENGKKVVLSNPVGDGEKITCGPDMTVTYSERNGTVRNGHIGFITDLTMSKGTVYLKFDEGTLTKEEFLMLPSSDADIIFEIEEISSAGMLGFNLKRIAPSKKSITFMVY